MDDEEASEEDLDCGPRSPTPPPLTLTLRINSSLSSTFTKLWLSEEWTSLGIRGR